MKISKRRFLSLVGTAGVGAALPGEAMTAQRALSNITAGVAAIGVDERKARVAKAQRLLREKGMAAVLLEAGSSLEYFTGVRWGRSERFTGAIIPKDGELAVVTPYFEDCGCSVHDYESDISRTWVNGEPTRQQREVWSTVKRGQELALETATLGTPAGKVDDVVRGFYESRGFGPGYRTPGLSHRLGHGIGVDGHEPVNFVHEETPPLAPGMCFSNEPGIYIFGEFGVRLEDCLHMTESGPRLFTELSRSIDRPFG